MNFLNEFDDRIASIFGAAPGGYAAPFSFRRLAKTAAHEMDHEASRGSEGVVAPCLYTILVSESDNALMRPLYGQITSEMSAYLDARARQKGYALAGTPLVRFMVDPDLRSGKFALFAEHVDSSTLRKLRAQEESFLRDGSGRGGAARPEAAARRPEARPVAPAAARPRSQAVPLADELPPLTPREVPMVNAPSSPAPVPVAAPAAHAARAVPLVDERAEAAVRPVAPAPTAGPAAAQVKAAAVPACTLVDRQTGLAYDVTSSPAVIGRERSRCDVILRDPNVSRQHARLAFEGGHWHVSDLRSTNGTQVNDVDVNECTLKDGDVITLGLTSLEFREL